ncbi:hypothetical protein Gotur_031405 [Gossypium turneri]
MVKKTLGHQKIEMAKIKYESNLQVTFSKRRSDFFKKASELCTLCGVEIAITVFSSGNKLIEAHHNAIILRLNAQLTEMMSQIEAQKKRGEELDKMRKASQEQNCFSLGVQTKERTQIQNSFSLGVQVKKLIQIENSFFLGVQVKEWIQIHNSFSLEVQAKEWIQIHSSFSLGVQAKGWIQIDNIHHSSSLGVQAKGWIQICSLEVQSKGWIQIHNFSVKSHDNTLE